LTDIEMARVTKPDVLGRLYTRGVAGVETREQLLEMKELLAEAESERAELRADNQRLREALLDAARDVDTRQAEINRLQAVLEELLQIGPSSTMGDFKRVQARAREALGSDKDG
jgi:chromosome segregation ATPase